MGAKLRMDEISAKTLPKLDELYASDKDKLTDLIMQTPAAPLRRLLLASLSRHTRLGEDGVSATLARFVEDCIGVNILAPDAETIETAVDVIGQDAQRIALSMSIARYNLYDND